MSNTKLVYRLISAGLLAVTLFSVVVVLGSSSTHYGVKHAIDIRPGATSLSESFTFSVSPLSSWRSHVLELRENYVQISSVENASSPFITVRATLKVNGADAEGFTHYIDTGAGFSSEYQLILPQSLLRVGENNVTLTYRIEVEARGEPTAGVELVYSCYQIRTS